MRHTFTPYELVKLKTDVKTNMQEMQAGEEVEVEGYWDDVTGGSWMWAQGNPACLVYAMRSATKGLPVDDEVVYVKYGGFGSLIHVSELEL